jgi:hypothetical protein
MGVATWQPDTLFDTLPHVEVRTLPAKAKWKGCLTCTELYLPDTHYIGRRTLPCMGEECVACLAGRARRHEGFASIVWQHNRRHEIVRLTPPAVSGILAAIGKGESCRGYVVELCRKGERSNGRVAVYVEREIFPVERLPASPPLDEHLARVWRIDGIDPTMGTAEYIAQLAAHLKKAMEIAAAKAAAESNAA